MPYRRSVKSRTYMPDDSKPPFELDPELRQLINVEVDLAGRLAEVTAEYEAAQKASTERLEELRRLPCPKAPAGQTNQHRSNTDWAADTGFCRYCGISLGND